MGLGFVTLLEKKFYLSTIFTQVQGKEQTTIYSVNCGKESNSIENMSPITAPKQRKDKHGSTTNTIDIHVCGGMSIVE